MVKLQKDARTMPIIIHNQEFKTKKAAEEYIRSVYKEIYALQGSRITHGMNHFEFMLQLFNRHPRASEKAPGGVYSFSVQKNIGGNLGAFVNSQVDFSFKVCLSPELDRKGRLDSALRASVANQIIIFNKTLKGTFETCDLCGDKISDYDETHVDHKIPFKNLKEDFLAFFGKTPPNEFDLSGEGSRFLEKDHEFETAWQKFHETKAELRVTHAKCNLNRRI